MGLWTAGYPGGAPNTAQLPTAGFVSKSLKEPPVSALFPRLPPPGPCLSRPPLRFGDIPDS
jgi:hypothetical protein